MTKFLFIFLFVFLSNNSYSQNHIISNDKDLLIFRFNFQDTLIIDIDTVYLFNKKTFNLYNKAYDAYRTNKTCALFYEPILLDLNNQIVFYKSEYNKINKLFIQSIKTHDTYLIESNKKIKELNDNITLMTINNSKLNQDIIDLNKSYRLKIFKTGIISFGAGCAATTIAWIIFSNKN